MTLKEKIEKLAKSIHVERFPEEYDHIYDSGADAYDRGNGINPMSQEYIDRVNDRRKGFGVSPLSESGMPVSNESMMICLDEAKKIVIEEI